MKYLHNILFGLVGILCFFFCYVISELNTGSIAVPMEYGGEAYTGIQNAEVKTGANIVFLSEIVAECFSLSFFVVGVIFIIKAIPTKKEFKPLS